MKLKFPLRSQIMHLFSANRKILAQNVCLSATDYFWQIFMLQYMAY